MRHTFTTYIGSIPSYQRINDSNIYELLILKTLQMLPNGLIILTFIWSLMRTVTFSHDSDKRDEFDFPIVNFPYLNSNIPESSAYDAFVHSWYVMIASVRNMKIFFCLEDLFWFQSYWNREILHINFRLLFGNSMVVIQTLFTNCTHLCHICWMVCTLTVTYDWFPVIWG